MFEECTLTTWENYLLFFLVGTFVVPGAVMLIDHTRGYFMLTYSFIFIQAIFWNLFHGWSSVDDQVMWADVSSAWLQTKSSKIGSKHQKNLKDNDLYYGSKRCMYISNHTSMADLFLMDGFYEARCSFLARYGVILFCPFPMIATLVMNSIWFFKRGGRGDQLEPFFKFLDRNFDWFFTARFHLCCFPEGHRSVKPYMLPVKEGMIRYAYERELIIQPLVVFGVENAMNEFTLRRSWNDKCILEYYICDILDPKDYKPESNSKVPKDQRNFESFFEKVRDTLYNDFETVHKLVLPENNRYRYLKEGTEKELYDQAPEGGKSKAMNDYAAERRRLKRH